MNPFVLYANLYALRNSGFETKEAFIESFFTFAPQTQENGGDSFEFLSDQFSQAVTKGTSSFRWNHYDTSGKKVPLQVSMVRVPWNTGFRVAVYGRSLSKELEELEKRRVAEKQTQLMLDSTPLICSMWDEQLTMIDCNLEAIRLLGLDDKSEYIGHFYQFNPTYQPDGEPSKEKAVRWLRQVLKTGYERFEWEYITRTGQPFPVETILIRIDWDNEYRILAYSRDLRELKAAESKEKEAEQRTLLMLDTLRSGSTILASALHRNATTEELIGANIALTKNKSLLSAVNQVAELILSSEREDFPLVIQKSLKLIGEGVGADRAALWETSWGEDGILYAKRFPGWKKNQSFENSARTMTLPLYDYVPEWKTAKTPHDIEFELGEMNKKLQTVSFVQGGKYLLLAPLFLQENFWGFVAIAHSIEGLHFSGEERNIIRSGSLMVAEAIIRNNLTENLQEIGLVAATDALTGLMNRGS